MKPKTPSQQKQYNFLYQDLLEQLNPQNPLLLLAKRIPWEMFENEFSRLYAERGRPGKPIRLILLKARQWGGSTAIQIYMAWLQLVHEVGLNSLIIAHQGTGSDEIKDMFDRMIKSYPVEMLHELGDAYAPNEPKMVGVGKSGNIFRVPQRNCKIKIGTAERPNSCRGGDYNLVHLSEVALYALAPSTTVTVEKTAKMPSSRNTNTPETLWETFPPPFIRVKFK